MILPLYATLEGLDETLLDAAADLGGRPRAVFFDITLPCRHRASLPDRCWFSSRAR